MVLPATGPRALPVETVNADSLDLTLYRISDRNLVATIRDGNFAQALRHVGGRAPNRRSSRTNLAGQRHAFGHAEPRNPARACPLAEAGTLQPGAYLLQAAVPGRDPYQTAPALAMVHGV